MLTENGIGAGAILHSDYSEVKDSNPAKPGETVLMYMNGLGPVTPQVTDGVSAPCGPLSVSDEAANISVLLDDGVSFSPANVLFAGLAPGFAGLYQVNFTVPASGLANGEVRIALGTIERSIRCRRSACRASRKRPRRSFPAAVLSGYGPPYRGWRLLRQACEEFPPSLAGKVQGQLLSQRSIPITVRLHPNLARAGWCAS